MSSIVEPAWILDSKWAIDLDEYNWVLKVRKSNRWIAAGYYRTPELLLKSLYRKISRTISTNSTLEQHLMASLWLAEACSARFLAQLESLGLSAQTTPQHAATIAHWGRND